MDISSLVCSSGQLELRLVGWGQGSREQYRWGCDPGPGDTIDEGLIGETRDKMGQLFLENILSPSYPGPLVNHTAARNRTLCLLNGLYPMDHSWAGKADSSVLSLTCRWADRGPVDFGTTGGTPGRCGAPCISWVRCAHMASPPS